MTVSKTCMQNQNVITAGEIEKRWSSTFFESRCLRSGKSKYTLTFNPSKITFNGLRKPGSLRWSYTRSNQYAIWWPVTIDTCISCINCFHFQKGISNWCVLFLLWHFKSYLAVCILVWILIFYNSILNF